MALVMVVAPDGPTVAAVLAALAAEHTVVVVPEAPAAYCDPAPDLVIVDLAGRPDGLDLVRRLKSTRRPLAPAVRVGVVAATGSEEERLESAIEGALLYVTRPVDPQRLRRQVERVLTGAPEEVQRKRVQDAALRALVRLERRRPRGATGGPPSVATPVPDEEIVPLRARLGELNERQRAVLEAIAVSDTREEARLRLGISRSLLGATLRSAASRLQFASVTELVACVRREMGHEVAPDDESTTVLFQPVVDIAGGRPLALEAQAFAVGHAGARLAGGSRWLVRRACEAARGWRRSGPEWADVGVAVDFPARLLAAPDAADDLLVIATAAGLPPAALTVEVADTVEAAANPAARQALVALRGAGVQLCVDHFGTHASSVASILQLDVDIVKLDGSLLRGTGTEDAEIIAAVVAFASSLAPMVEAEGVETVAQLTVLESAGCRAVQGPLVGAAGPAPESTIPIGRSRVSPLDRGGERRQSSG